MDSVLSSTLNGALSQRESATAVDLSSLVNSSSAEATTDRGISTMGQFSAAEKDFEARNWRAARDVFQYQGGHKDKKAMAEFLRQQESPQQAKASCTEASNRASMQYKPGLEGILSKIEAFMQVGDVAMTAAPESVGLAWMGIRLCMHSVEDDFDTFNLFSGAASDIIGILISCRVYGKMYGGDGGQKGLPDFQELHGKVVDYIPKIYTAILEFSYQMSKQIGRNMGTRLLKGLLSSASNKFRSMIDNIRGMEKTMSEYAKKATDQLSIYYLEVGLEKQGTGLENQRLMMANLAVIKDTLNSNLEIQKRYVDQLKQVEEEKKNMKKKTPLDKAKEKFDENAKQLKPTGSLETAFLRNRDRKVEGTCEWIFELEEYKAWRTSTDNKLIWISGVGGMGKSILVSNIIHRLQTEMNDSAECSLHYFICSAGDDATRLAKRIKDQLLFQLYVLSKSQESADVLDKANELIDKYLAPADAAGGSQQKKLAPIVFEETYPSLARLLKKKIYLIIDALDECADRKDSSFLRMLQDMLCLSNYPDFRLHVIICSRPEADIENDLADKPVIKVEQHNGPDIEHAAKLKLGSLPGLSPAERALASEAIVKKAKGLFRCVEPAIEFLKKPLQRPLEKALEKLPVGLDNSYQQILRQTDPEYLVLLKTALHWTILGQREPTIAEIMDDYSCAYEQAEGSSENPYDDLDNPTMTDESRRLIPDQIRAAGSSTFLDVSGNIVTTRHTTVADFFLRATSSTKQPVDDCMDVICPNCSSRAASDSLWSLTQKEGQLRMAITIFKHLNSPLFRSRYLPDDPDTQKPEQVTESLDNVNGLALGPSQENGPTESVTSDTEHVALSTTEASPEEHGSGPSQTLQPGTLDAPNIKSSVPENDGDAEDADEHVDPAKIGAEEEQLAEQDRLTDDENSSFMGSAVSDPEGSEDHGGIVRPVRYELIYWPHHLQAAEKLWTPEERLTNNDWKELWRLVLKFFCDSPSAFSTWQRKRDYMTLPWHIFIPDGDDGALNPLQIAAAYGLTGLCEVLIQRGLSAAAETPDGRSALWFAAEHSLELLRLLLENGASPNACKEYPSPFHMLLWRNPNLEGVKLMLEYKGDCSQKDSSGMTVIHWFAFSGSDVNLLRLLIANGGVINATDSFGETGLHKLMWQNPVPIPLLHEFIKSGADVNLSDEESQQPLYEVCLEGSVEGATILLDHGADIEHADVNGTTALHLSASCGHLEVIKLLVERKASLIKRDKHLRTAFYLACANNHFESARYLLSAAHDQGLHESIFHAMDDGRTPFSKACGRGHLEIVEMLLAHADANIDVNAIEGTLKRTALHWASYNARVDIVLLLLEKGANATVADANGKTPLSLSGLGWFKDHSLDREPMIIALIEHDRSTAAQDTDLMAIAAIRGSANVIERLLDAKAHPSKQDEHGWTPLQLARQYGNTEAAAVLEMRGAVVGSRPNRWVTELSRIRVSEDGRGLEYIDEAEKNPQMILANHPIPAGIERFYFEVEIRPHIGKIHTPFNAIGFATQPARLDQMPGWFNAVAPSWAFHGDDGKIFANKSMSSQKYAEPYGKGDTIGCGVIFQNGVDGIIFYTRNGKSLGVAFDKSVRGRLYPAIGMSEPAAITTQWGEDGVLSSFVWGPANGGRFDLEDIKMVSTDESNAATIVPTRINLEPSASLAKA